MPQISVQRNRGAGELLERHMRIEDAYGRLKRHKV